MINFSQTTLYDYSGVLSLHENFCLKATVDTISRFDRLHCHEKGFKLTFLGLIEEKLRVFWTLLITLKGFKLLFFGKN